MMEQGYILLTEFIDRGDDTHKGWQHFLGREQAEEWVAAERERSQHSSYKLVQAILIPIVSESL